MVIKTINYILCDSIIKILNRQWFVKLGCLELRESYVRALTLFTRSVTFKSRSKANILWGINLEKKNPLLYNQNKIHLETISKKNYISDMKLKSIK